MEDENRSILAEIAIGACFGVAAVLMLLWSVFVGKDRSPP